MSEETTKSTDVFNINIAGLPLSLRSSHSKEKVDRLVKVVNQKVEATMRGGSQISFQKSLVITCLELAAESLEVKQQAQTELAAAEKKARHILEVLDSPEITQMGL